MNGKSPVHRGSFQVFRPQYPNPQPPDNRSAPLTIIARIRFRFSVFVFNFLFLFFSLLRFVCYSSLFCRFFFRFDSLHVFDWPGFFFVLYARFVSTPLVFGAPKTVAGTLSSMETVRYTRYTCPYATLYAVRTPHECGCVCVCVCSHNNKLNTLSSAEHNQRRAERH